MKKIRTLLIAAAIAVGGGVSPLTVPARAHGPIYYEIHYFPYWDPGMNYESAHVIEYCDGHYSHSGYPDVHSWQAYYECP
jgi:hypothetical protein